MDVLHVLVLEIGIPLQTVQLVKLIIVVVMVLQQELAALLALVIPIGALHLHVTIVYSIVILPLDMDMLMEIATHVLVIITGKELIVKLVTLQHVEHMVTRIQLPALRAFAILISYQMEEIVILVLLLCVTVEELQKIPTVIVVIVIFTLPEHFAKLVELVIVKMEQI